MSKGVLMGVFQVGVKNYDNDWFLKYGFSYEDAARLLRDWGVSFVISLNRFLPMPDSAVLSEVAQERATDFAAYDDRKFRDALFNEGIDYWATVCMFFEPQALEADPKLRPMGSDGHPMEKIDWYSGIAPSMKEYVEQKTARIVDATRALSPDGVFMSFTRWPGFWELWTPQYSRQDFPEYSYDIYTLERFSHETGVHVPTRDPLEAAGWIEANARDIWTDWKCGVVVDVIRQVKDACRQVKPDIEIMLNTVPFGQNDFDNAGEKTFGQRWEELAEVVDVFEVMTYHQILKRPIEWIGQIGGEAKRRTGRKTICTIQSRPLYLEGIHAKEERNPKIEADEFKQAVRGVLAANLDGLVVFVWSDLLEMVQKYDDNDRVSALKDIAG
jgi:hypothetical protein